MSKLSTWTLLLLALVLPVQAAVIADHPADYVAVAPTPGWAYLTAGVGDLGNSAAYQALQWNTNISAYAYMSTGTWNGTDWGGRYTYIKSNTLNVGLPGEYTILAYTIQPGEVGGNINLEGVFAGNDRGGADLNSDGWQLAIYVNDNLITSMVQAWTMSPLSLNRNLGPLNVGDTVYVAVGAGNTNWYDRATLDMRLLNNVPEPGTLALVGAGALLLGLARRRR